MLGIHLLEQNDGAQRGDGVRGYVARANAARYTVRWADGTTTEHEQGDPDVEGFVWQGDDYDDELLPTRDPLFREIRADWRFWRHAAPRPDSTPLSAIIPIEADTTGYGYPDA